MLMMPRAAPQMQTRPTLTRYILYLHTEQDAFPTIHHLAPCNTWSFRPTVDEPPGRMHQGGAIWRKRWVQQHGIQAEVLKHSLTSPGHLQARQLSSSMRLNSATGSVAGRQLPRSHLPPASSSIEAKRPHYINPSVILYKLHPHSQISPSTTTLYSKCTSPTFSPSFLSLLSRLQSQATFPSALR